MCRYGCRSEGLGTSDPSLAVAEGFPCSVAGLMAVPLSLVTHDTRAYAQMPLANHSLERERPSTAQAAALSDQHIPTGICTQRVTGRGPAPMEYSTAFIFKGRFGEPPAPYGLCSFRTQCKGKSKQKRDKTSQTRERVVKRGHEGIEPSTSPTLKENHTTRPMARARARPAQPAGLLARLRSRHITVHDVDAFRAPLAERSAVNRQVLGSIPSGGALFFFFLCFNFNFFFFRDGRVQERDVLPRPPRRHGAMAARGIPNPKAGGSNPSGVR